MSADLLLGAAWGVIAASPFTVAAARVAPRRRVVALAGLPATHAVAPSERRHLVWFRALRATAPVRVVANVLGAPARRRRELATTRELPVVVDLLRVAVGAGCTPFLAVDVAGHWAPEPFGPALRGVRRVCELGVSFGDALGGVADALPSIEPVTAALQTSERLGTPVAPVLERLADEQRARARRRAEAHARRIPVRLLFPLVFLVLPSFVLLTVVPGLAAGLARL